MSKNSKRWNFKVWLTAIWLVFTISLSIWWIIFGLRQLDQLNEARQGNQSVLVEEKLVNQHKMILWEGSILLISLLAGGGALLFYVIQERKQSRRLKEFFATFSHEIKTSLTSLRLQTESLQEDLESEDKHSVILDRLTNDTVRLQIQLENSLFLSNLETAELFEQKIRLKEIFRSYQAHWPAIKINLANDAEFYGDTRAIESVFSNLIQNAISHGSANEINVEASVVEGQILVDLKDNGDGFQGNPERLGSLFHRHTVRSGSGVGLYIVKQLMKKMGGKIEFKALASGFSTQLYFKGTTVSNFESRSSSDIRDSLPSSTGGDL